MIQFSKHVYDVSLDSELKNGVGSIKLI